MSHRRAPSNRYQPLSAHLKYTGTERRKNNAKLYADRERRQLRGASAALPTPPNPAPLVHTPPDAPEVRRPAHAEIAAQAYQLYMQSGCQADREYEFWLEAEAFLLARARQAAMEQQRRIWEEYHLQIEHDLAANAERHDERLWLSRIPRPDEFSE